MRSSVILRAKPDGVILVFKVNTPKTRELGSDDLHRLLRFEDCLSEYVNGYNENKAVNYPHNYVGLCVRIIHPLDAHSKYRVGKIRNGWTVDPLENWTKHKSAESFLEVQNRGPVLAANYRDVFGEDPIRSLWFIYKDHLFEYPMRTSGDLSKEVSLDIMECLDQERKKYERLRAKFVTLKNEALHVREPIPEEVRIVVWNRDGGRCTKCGSREKLEFDHIIPVTKGGSNTARNIELLCEKCNRAKSDHIL